MKKSYLFGLCAASLLLTTSCQKDNLFGMWQDNKNEPVTVKMSVSLPEMSTATRATAKPYGDGTTATVLNYGVFEVFDDNNDKAIDRRVYLKDVSSEGAGVMTMSNLKATVALKLMPGSSYEVYFWATAANAPYSLKFADNKATVGVHTSQLFSNNENNDAFFGQGTITNVGYDGGTFVEADEEVVLKRPFAQLNIGTSDFEAAAKAGFKVDKTEVVIAKGVICEELDLLTGKATANAAPVTYQKSNIPGDEYCFPIKPNEYKHMAMNYLLVTEDSQVLQEADAVTLNYYCGDRVKSRTFNQIPVRRNWRTNIYGELLTSDVHIEVSINPLFADENGVDDDSKWNPDENEWYDREQDKQ